MRDSWRGFETVWLAPDNVAVNLPFDVLGRSQRDIPGDRHNFVIIECSRDFLFGVDGAANGSGSLIIGNPKYLLNEKTALPKAKQDGDKLTINVTSFGSKENWGTDNDIKDSTEITLEKTSDGLRIGKCDINAVTYFSFYDSITYEDISVSLN